MKQWQYHKMVGDTFHFRKYNKYYKVCHLAGVWYINPCDKNEYLPSHVRAYTPGKKYKWSRSSEWIKEQLLPLINDDSILILTRDAIVNAIARAMLSDVLAAKNGSKV